MSDMIEAIAEQNEAQSLSLLYRKSSLLGESLQSVYVYFKMQDSEIFRERFPLYTNMWEVQQQIASNLNVAPERVILKFNGENLHPWLPLAGLDYDDRLFFLFDLEILKEPISYPSSDSPKVMTRKVRIYDDFDRSVEVTVQIEIENNKKQWLGGLRNKITGVAYHHASVQTMRKRTRYSKIGEPPPETSEESSQTLKYHPREEYTQTRHDHGTQMDKPGLYMPTHRDRIIEPGTYKPYVKVKREMPNLIALQKFQKLLDKEEKIKTETQDFFKEEIEKKHAERFDWNYIATTLYPTDRYGFENLYHLVNTWYKDERKRLLQGFILPNDPGYKASMINLFKKKSFYYRQIDVLRTKWNVETWNKRRMNMFEEASKPKITLYEKGNITLTETCAVQRYKVLKEIYSSYIREDYVEEERITMLLELIVFLESAVPIDLAMPVIELINREIDSISMGIKHLKGLRLRITEFLFNYFTLTDFDKAESYARHDEDQPTISCLSCNRLKPKKEFFRRNRFERRHCRSCVWLRRRNTGFPSMGPYKMMLEEMKKAEVPDENSVLNLMEPEELYTLANKIWNGRSTISGCSDLSKLCLAKWRVGEPWSPWNCILLTVGEAHVHESIKRIEKFYDPNFLDEVKRRHLEAKIEFKRLQKDVEDLQKGRLLDRPKVSKERMKEIYDRGDPFFKEAICKARRSTLEDVSK